ncbi:hypothetical protein [Varunaivibrio sulfuroxidans]|uniref:Uncharacterized protein n=1 Tax=Varunaivibrio sulfuroxidans TaxID=1773489 RepID=A0A4R3JE41_9PROT|nr:hypothetical protein [Varunaivibrio sulfuroxidans]TCS63473.1 hypothetical protein EDD55_10394 [Varunaivibrio sulfuroxidans]WES30381.1 hypothetical protein P3M64_12175 [Varunaivibrio sulfuroxidans]
MDITERRNVLQVHPNPDSKIDYVVTLEGHLTLKPYGDRMNVVLRYVPDRHILEAGSFGDYLDLVMQEEWPTPEALAVTILSDVTNETVARWLQLGISSGQKQHHAIDSHGVTLEDRQPKWDNASLLSRMRKY